MFNNKAISNSNIRLLSEADVELYRVLRLRALQENPEAFGAAYEESADKPLSEMAKPLDGSNDSFVLAAFSPQIVGMVGFFRSEGIKRRHNGNFWGVYVTPEARGKGLAKALLRTAIARAAQISGVEQLLLGVATTNQPARNLYVSLGFVSYGIQSKMLKIGDQYTDEDLMMLKLHHNANGEKL